MRDVSNTANLLGWMFSFQESIWKWTFRELKNITVGTRAIHDNMMDPIYKSSQNKNHETWAYKNLDKVFGYPTIVRFSHLRTKKTLTEQAVYIYWTNDKLDYSHKTESFSTHGSLGYVRSCQ